MADVKGFDEILSTPGLSEDTRAIVYALRAVAVNQCTQMQQMRYILSEVAHGMSVLTMTTSTGHLDSDMKEQAVIYMQHVTKLLEALSPTDDTAGPTEPQT